MSLPGFIVEASLYRTAAYYRRATAGLGGSAGVVAWYKRGARPPATLGLVRVSG